MAEAISRVPHSTRHSISDQNDNDKKTENGRGYTNESAMSAMSAAVDDPRISTNTSLSSLSSWHRKLDGLYLVFFVVHIPTILCTSLNYFSLFKHILSAHLPVEIISQTYIFVTSLIHLRHSILCDLENEEIGKAKMQYCSALLSLSSRHYPHLFAFSKLNSQIVS